MAKELRYGEEASRLLQSGVEQLAEEQTPWGGSRALMTEFGAMDECLRQPSPDSSTPQSMGLGPSVG